MLTAQRIVKTYRRKRIIVCLALAITTLLLTTGVRYLTERNRNDQRVTLFTARAVATVESLLEPLAAARSALFPLVGQPCENVEGPLRVETARLQTLRAIVLVKDGVVYCSSIFGSRNELLRQLQPKLPSPYPQMLLTRDNSLLKGSSVMIIWTPTSPDGQDGILQALNIELLARLMLEPARPWVDHVVLNVGDVHLEYGKGVVQSLPGEPGLETREGVSGRFPFSVTVIGPPGDRLALKALPGQLPLALILSLLIGYIAWLATAGRMSFSHEINLGLAAREFEIYCQPLVNARNQQCTGVEILLRWNNPRQGFISPDVFIPLAEQQNLIAPLTRYVLAETASQVHYFPVSPHFHIGINVAASHFHRGKIVEDLQQFWFTRQPSHPLFLELTERDALPDVDHRVVRDLHELGVKLAIDDFGTGQSSLAYLEMLHPDVLKIDKTFTAAIGTDAVNSTVTDIIIALGNRLHIDLVAEGVETAEQAAYLRRRGVTALQGYLYAKPMPLHAFPAWLENHPDAENKKNGAALGAAPLR